MSVRTHDIFRLVSLRGPRKLTHDVAEGVPETDLFKELDSKNPDPVDPDPKLADTLKKFKPVEENELAYILLLDFEKQLEKAGKLTLKILQDFKLDYPESQKIDLKTLVTKSPHKDVLSTLMGVLSDGWLIYRLGSILNKKRPQGSTVDLVDLSKAADIHLIEKLLRVGWIAQQFVLDPDALRDEGACEALRQVRVVFPKRWRREKYQREKVREAQREILKKREAQRAEFKPRVGELKKGLEARRKRIQTIEKVQEAAEALYISKLREASEQMPSAGPTDTPRVPGAFERAFTYLVGKPAEKAEPPDPQPAMDVDAAFRAKYGDVMKEVIATSLSEKEQKLFQDEVLPAPRENETYEAFRSRLLRTLEDQLRAANEDACDISLWESEVTTPEPDQAPTPPNDDNFAPWRSLGIGELIVAREKLLGYRADEIAHIENVLPGEVRVREHELTTSREVTEEVEKVEETESERDLETTDRFELQTQSEKAINQEFSVEAGVDTSGTYGLTTVNTSLDAEFSVGVDESRSSSTNIAKEIVSKAAERSRKVTRELRRTVFLEKIRELNTHTIDRKDEKEKPFSGVYYWVERIHEVQLRHYGSRLMYEFHVPEPGLSLLPSNADETHPFKKPAPFTLRPEEIDEHYLCLTAKYGATGVEPPPAEAVHVGYSWSSTPDPEKYHLHHQVKCFDAKSDFISIPDGYEPLGAVVRFVGGTPNDSVGIFVQLANKTAYSIDSVGPGAEWVELSRTPVLGSGLPVSIRMHHHAGKTGVVHIWVECRRTATAMNKWRLTIFEQLKEAHEILMSDYERKVAEAQIRGGVRVEGRAPAENRAREIEELKKWSIKAMRLQPFDFNAVVHEQEQPEVDPVLSGVEAPVVRFFEQAFEWRQMSYFLYPYYWGRRDESGSFGYRRNLSDPDPLHQSFLRAGSARVIVPVTPGYEERVIHYLADPGADELGRVNWPPPAQQPQNGDETDTSDPPVSEAEDAWLEILMNKNHDVQLGTGTLKVTKDSKEVTINEDSQWHPDARDLGRDLYIEAEVYTVEEILAVGADGVRKISLDREYKYDSADSVRYGTGSVPVGEPWNVTLPTTHLILGDQRHKLKVNVEQDVSAYPEPDVSSSTPS